MRFLWLAFAPQPICWPAFNCFVSLSRPPIHHFQTDLDTNRLNVSSYLLLCPSPLYLCFPPSLSFCMWARCEERGNNMTVWLFGHTDNPTRPARRNWFQTFSEWSHHPNPHPVHSSPPPTILPPLAEGRPRWTTPSLMFPPHHSSSPPTTAEVND